MGFRVRGLRIEGVGFRSLQFQGVWLWSFGSWASWPWWAPTTSAQHFAVVPVVLMTTRNPDVVMTVFALPVLSVSYFIWPASECFIVCTPCQGANRAIFADMFSEEESSGAFANCMMQPLGHGLGSRVGCRVLRILSSWPCKSISYFVTMFDETYEHEHHDRDNYNK